MRKVLIAAALFAVNFTAAPAFADETAAPAATSGALNLKVGESITGANGKRIGRIYQLSRQGDAQIIDDLRLLTVPASTLTRTDGKLVSTLSLRDLTK